MHLIFNLSLCTGCKICQLVCSAEHDQVFNPEKARLKIMYNYSDEGVHIATKSCIFCKKCVKACPEGAISHNGKWMIVDHEICTGCGICIEACPQDVIFLHDDQAVICDFCQGAPKCIAWCPKGVISSKEKGGRI